MSSTTVCDLHGMHGMLIYPLLYQKMAATSNQQVTYPASDALHSPQKRLYVPSTKPNAGVLVVRM